MSKLTARTCRAAFSEAAGGQDSVDDGVESRTGPHRLADGVGGVHGEENHIYTVGGFNPSEEYESMGRIIPYIMENKKCLKPPTSISMGDLQDPKMKVR